MGLFSSLFGTSRPRPTSAEMGLLAEYARLAEEIGIESLVQGVDLALLPTSREHLKEIIAKATLSAWAGIVLKPDDLEKLYGCLAFFLSPDQLILVEEARAIEARIQASQDVAGAESRKYEEGIRLLANAHEQIVAARCNLQAHATSLIRK
ncbi:MAG: hypothetical protein KF766_13885 [Rhodocyclaceae bacterium]|nr:hypothetical protein [Rhodocyclaceae bacterium]